MAGSRGRRPIGLRALQRLQRRFDQERGFDFPELDNGANVQLDFDRMLLPDERTREALMRRVEFTTMALSGELGELSNFVKKARRAAWQGSTISDFMAQAGTEAADIFAYLLKLCDLVGWDLYRQYLEKVAENCLRFPVRAVEGRRGQLITVAGGSVPLKNHFAAALQQYLNDSRTEDAYDVLSHVEITETFEDGANLRQDFEALAKLLHSQAPEKNVIVTSDPSLLVRGFARCFEARERLAASEYESLLFELIDLESHLGKWSGIRAIVVLDSFTSEETTADAESLRRAYLGAVRPAPHFVVDPEIETKERAREIANELIERGANAR